MILRTSRRVRIVADPLPPEPPFVGTRIRIDVSDSLVWGVKSAALADGHSSVRIDWGDGVCETRAGIADATHAYAKSGQYEVRISDDIASLACSHYEGEFRAHYAPMIRSVVSDATCLAELSHSAFAQAVNLAEARLPVALVSFSSFTDCASLPEVFLPKAVEVQCSILPTRPFYGCGNLSVIHFAKANEAVIKASSGYQTDPAFGSEKAVCAFDL